MQTNSRIAEKFDEYLLAQEAKNKQRVRSGKMSPSSFGQCHRRQLYNRRNEPVTDPIPVETLRVFEAGKWFHAGIQKFFPEAQVEVEVSDDNVYGFADIVEDDCVTDIKTVGQWAFKAMQKDDYDPWTAHPEYILQCCVYAVKLGKPTFRLVFVCKENLEIKEYKFETSKFADLVKTEININRGYFETGALPPAEPRLYKQKDGSYKECAYCAFKKTCDKAEGKSNDNLA